MLVPQVGLFCVQVRLAQRVEGHLGERAEILPKVPGRPGGRASEHAPFLPLGNQWKMMVGRAPTCLRRGGRLAPIVSLCSVLRVNCPKWASHLRPQVALECRQYHVIFPPDVTFNILGMLGINYFNFALVRNERQAHSEKRSKDVKNSLLCTYFTGHNTYSLMSYYQAKKRLLSSSWEPTMFVLNPS